MKKFALIFAFALSLSLNAYADVCVEVSKDVAAKAISLIEKQTEIYEFCSICDEAKPQILTVQNITKDKSVYIDGKSIDLAHTYFRQDNEYLNLGIASGCIEDGKYGISAKLDNLAEFHHTKENDKNLDKQQANAIFDECVSRIENNKSKTTQDMIEHNIKINNCLVEAVKQEIQKGFNPQQQAQMLEYLEQTRNGVWNFYNEIYTANKYCYGQCGSMSSLLAYSDEGHILMQMLERLLYLNRAKNGY